MHALLSSLVLACQTPAPPRATRELPAVVVEVAAPWRVAVEESERVVVRWGDSPHGARVDVPADPALPVGVSLILHGRPWPAEPGAGAPPLVAVGWEPRPTRRLSVSTEGPDLLVRAEGPPLRAWSEDATAPDDPGITWVRLRPRGEDWRVVVDGVATIALPPGRAALAPGAGWTLEGDWGAARFDTDAVGLRSLAGPARYLLDLRPSLAARKPYPRTALTLRPSAQPFTPPAVSPSTK
jgi:hypothetical protein